MHTTTTQCNVYTFDAWEPKRLADYILCHQSQLTIGKKILNEKKEHVDE
jgi:hypothetical protein